MTSLFGIRNNTIFGETPSYVDISKPPGHSTQPLSWKAWYNNITTGQFFFFSPNFTWCTIAIFVYNIFPYNYDLAINLRSSEARFLFLSRFCIHFTIVGLYYLFWHVSLYYCNCGKRKFNGIKKQDDKKHDDDDTQDNNEYLLPEYPYPTRRTMIHNLFYWTLGILQWTCWEIAFVHLYATNKMSLNLSPSNPSTSLFVLILGTLLIPIWRGFHFYLSHRFLHIRPIYRFVHSLHHRNVDIEPFAGLCMHPVEHLYYFACLAPTIWFGGPPFLMLWNGYHLLLSPAASHSGYEDHTFQSDQFHYLHHAKFECNYGSASMPFDHSNGTFTANFKATTQPLSKTMTNSMKKKNQERPMIAFKDVVSATKGDFVYTMVMFGLCILLLNRICGNGTLSNWLLNEHMFGFVIGFGPVLTALVLRFIIGDSLKISWPFHKEKYGIFGSHLILGCVMTCLPTYQLVVMMVQ